MAQSRSKVERLKIVFERLQNAPAAKAADEAMAIMNRVLEEVEDEFGGVPKDPNPGLIPSDRMYPPEADNIARDPNGNIIANSRRHSTTFGKDGSIVITRRQTGVIVLRKAGG
jgi:hypothetical protein